MNNVILFEWGPHPYFKKWFTGKVLPFLDVMFSPKKIYCFYCMKLYNSNMSTLLCSIGGVEPP